MTANTSIYFTDAINLHYRSVGEILHCQFRLQAIEKFIPLPSDPMCHYQAFFSKAFFQKPIQPMDINTS
jgi:hypothetical protein